MAKANNTFHVTPAGIATGYVYLTKPDEGNEKTGKLAAAFKVTIAMPAADLLAEELYGIVEQAHADQVAKGREAWEAKAAAARKAGSKPPSPFREANLPMYRDEANDVITLSAKLYRDRQKDGKPFSQAPKIVSTEYTIVNGKKVYNPWDLSVDIWTGSEMRLQVEIVPFDTPTAGAGVSLRLRYVQVTKLVNGANGSDPFGDDAGEDEDSDIPF